MRLLIIGLFIVSVCMLIYSFIELFKSNKAYKEISDKNEE